MSKPAYPTHLYLFADDELLWSEPLNPAWCSICINDHQLWPPRLMPRTPALPRAVHRRRCRG
jgi:hypothetical protein